jgi:hypothetical protein
MARELKPGDLVQGVEGMRRVIAVDRVIWGGFAAPLTRDGRIVVGGCVASCYAHTTQGLGDVSTYLFRKFSYPDSNKGGLHWYFGLLQKIGSVLGLITI